MSLHVVIPLVGKDSFSNTEYPKPLKDVGRVSMIEVVLGNLAPPTPCRFTFVCLKDHVQRFHLDQSLKVLAPGTACVVAEGFTSGQLCSVLLAIDTMNPDDELLIANGDQFIAAGLPGFYAKCRESAIDGCILTFDSSHPKWSFVRLNAEGLVDYVAEKRPISNEATAGLYYFRNTGRFLSGAKSMLLKGASSEGKYYVAPVYNELILEGAKVVTYRVKKDVIFSFDTSDDIRFFCEWELRSRYRDKV